MGQITAMTTVYQVVDVDILARILYLKIRHCHFAGGIDDSSLIADEVRS